MQAAVSTRITSFLLWPSLFIIIIAAWTGLAMMSVGHPGPAASLGVGMTAIDWLIGAPGWGAFIEALCLTDAGDIRPSALAAMWALMALAMMLPTALPFFATYNDFRHAKPDQVTIFALAALIGGYLIVWLAFSLGASVIQLGLAQIDLLSSYGVSNSLWLNAGLLFIAGAYQFIPAKLKAAHGCQTPMQFYMRKWKPGASGAYVMGIDQGLMCVTCCWALMMLAFVGGTMNLLWMAGAMLVMTLEKLPNVGKALSAPLGVVLVYAAVLTGLTAAGII